MANADPDDEQPLVNEEEDEDGQELTALQRLYPGVDFTDPDVLTKYPELNDLVPEHNPNDPNADLEEFIRKRPGRIGGGDANDETCGPFVAEKEENVGCCKGRCTGEMFGGCGKMDYVQVRYKI